MLVQAGIVNVAILSDLNNLTLNFLVALLKHGNKLPLKLQGVAQDRLNFQFEICLKLKVSDYL